MCPGQLLLRKKNLPSDRPSIGYASKFICSWDSNPTDLCPGVLEPTCINSNPSLFRFSPHILVHPQAISLASVISLMCLNMVCLNIASVIHSWLLDVLTYDFSSIWYVLIWLNIDFIRIIIEGIKLVPNSLKKKHTKNWSKRSTKKSSILDEP